jgi:hypothetical protein
MCCDLEGFPQCISLWQRNQHGFGGVYVRERTHRINADKMPFEFEERVTLASTILNWYMPLIAKRYCGCYQRDCPEDWRELNFVVSQSPHRLWEGSGNSGMCALHAKMLQRYRGWNNDAVGSRG